MLEHEAHLALAHVPVRGIVAIEQDAPRIGMLEPGDDPEQRGLAAAGGPQQRDELARREIERDVVQGNELAEGLADALDRDAHGASP